MALKQGPISPDELAQKLANSRKIMSKVQTGDYEKGNINEGALISDDVDVQEGDVPLQPIMPPSRGPKNLGLPVGVPSVEKIRQSKLPEAIKTAMIEKPIPIPEVSLNEGFDMKFVNKAKQLMEQDNPKKTTRPPIITETNPQLYVQDTPSNIEQIIENVIRKVLDEKLTQILTAQHMSTINENLAIKVGNSIFTGKITKVKNSK